MAITRANMLQVLEDNIGKGFPNSSGELQCVGLIMEVANCTDAQDILLGAAIDYATSNYSKWSRASVSASNMITGNIAVIKANYSGYTFWAGHIGVIADYNSTNNTFGMYEQNVDGPPYTGAPIRKDKIAWPLDSVASILVPNYTNDTNALTPDEVPNGQIPPSGAISTPNSDAKNIHDVPDDYLDLLAKYGINVIGDDTDSKEWYQFLLMLTDLVGCDLGMLNDILALLFYGQIHDKHQY